MSTIEKAAARLKTKPASAIPVSDKDIEQQSLAEAPAAPSNLPRDVVEPTPADSGHATYCEIDFKHLAENGFLVPGHNNHQQSQEFRRIKRPLLLNLQTAIAKNLHQPTNVIFVTSALPGEGKTFVSMNLALSLAQEVDRSVLLIDGDAAKGDLSRWMGMYEQPGLVDLLTSGNGYAESSILETNIDRLSVMACGRRVDNLDELYASDLMSSIVMGMATRDPSRLIIVDGPPLIPTTEAAVLAGHMGQVVLVVESNKTPQTAVEDATDQLEDCQLVSMLLNKASGSSGSYGYGYGYGQAENQ